MLQKDPADQNNPSLDQELNHPSLKVREGEGGNGSRVISDNSDSSQVSMVSATNPSASRVGLSKGLVSRGLVKPLNLSSGKISSARPDSGNRYYSTTLSGDFCE